jgi:ABC-2 type transport system permease protein
MFTLLIKTRLLGLYNTARYAASRHKLLSAGLTLFGIVLFAGVYFGFKLFLDLGDAHRTTGELTYEIFYFLFLFLLAGAVPFVASTLLHSSDYLLLGAAPVRPRAIVAAKLLDATVTNSLQFTVIGVPAIAASAAALNLSVAAWPALAYLIGLFVLLPALATALLLLVALSLFGMRRVRSAIATVNIVMATAVCLTIVVQVNRLPVHHGMTSLLMPGSPVASSSARLSPSAWFADALIKLSAGETAAGMTQLGQLTLLVTLLFGCCMLLGDRLLSAASLSEETEGQTAGDVVEGPVRASRSGALSVFSSPVAALIAKDLKYVARDSVLLGQLGMPVILFLVPFVLGMQESLRSVTSLTELYVVSTAMTAFIIFMQTSILSLSSIGIENRSFWLVLASPNGGKTLLWAKFVMSTIVSGSVGVVLTLMNGFVFRAPIPTVLTQCAATVLMAAALCGMGVGISAALPRFVYENPAHRVSVWAMILGFFGSVAYIIVAGVVVMAAALLVVQMPDYSTTIYAVSGSLFLLITLASAFIPMAIGARRIEVYQWEH